MQRWIVALSLGIALVTGAFWLPAPARAQAGDVTVEETDTGTTTKPADTTTPATDTTTPATDTTTPVTETAPAAPPVPSKAMIRDMFEQGKVTEAETAYLSWAAYWQIDDPVLVVPIIRTELMNEFRAGKPVALIGLAQAGDKEALNVLLAQVLSNGDKWPPTDLIPALRFIGLSGNKEAQNVLRTMLYNENPGVVNAAIEALGNLRDPRVAPELNKMLDEADLERSVVLVGALAKLGKSKQLLARFEPQLKFPLPGVQEKAALVLAALGQQKGWPQIQHMLQAKEAPYYPLAITVLGALPTQESVAFVTAALSGNENEQLAGLQSLNILPAEKQEATLMLIMHDENRATSVRVQAIRMLAARKVDRAAKDLRILATKLDGEDPIVKAEAMASLPAFGMTREFSVREVIRQRISSDEEAVARAARVALLSYALSIK